MTVNGLPASFSSTNSSNFGWTAGIGVEWAFGWYGLSARAEWDYVRLNNQTFTVGPGSAFATDVITDNNRQINIFTAGLNYKFGGSW